MRVAHLQVHETGCKHRGKFSADEEMITIKLVGYESEEFHYRFKMTMKMSKLMSWHRSMLGQGPDLRFLFDGRKIKIEENPTPKSLAMETDDVVEFYHENTGS